MDANPNLVEIQRQCEQLRIEYEDYRKKYFIAQFGYNRLSSYYKWLEENYPSAEVLAAQRSEANAFSAKPLISVLVPVYKTPIQLLRECFESVVMQSYDNWQLCVIDDKSEQPELTAVLEEYAAKYPGKFKFSTREENGHISAASNDALTLADGEFVALLDHDDLLWPNALYEVVSALNKSPDTDFFYTDEDKVEDGMHVHPYLKPGFNKLFLMGCNYITHLVVVRTSTVRSVGGFRKGVEGAQDWDLFLRITAETKNITHIPRILYSWRIIETSTAQRGFEAKPYAYEAQRKAVMDYCKRNKVTITDALLPHGFVGWQISFNLMSPTLGVLIRSHNDLAGLYGILRKVQEAATKDNIKVKYIVQSPTPLPELMMLDKDFIEKIDLDIHVGVPARMSFKKVAQMFDTDYVLSISGITDIRGEDGWLNNLLGYANMDGVFSVTGSVRHKDHSIASAGWAFDRKGSPVALLKGYMPDADQRLDTNLFSPRQVGFADPRGFAFKTDKIPRKLGNRNIFQPPPFQKRHQTDEGLCVYSPFVSFYLTDSLVKRSFANTMLTNKDMPEIESRYWGYDYLDSISWE